MPRHGMAQTLLAVLHEDVLHIPPPTNYGRAVKDADSLAKAGCTPDEIRDIAKWLINDPFWGPKGVTINRILAKRDDWLSAKANAGGDISPSNIPEPQPSPDVDWNEPSPSLAWMLNPDAKKPWEDEEQ